MIVTQEVNARQSFDCDGWIQVHQHMEEIMTGHCLLLSFLFLFLLLSHQIGQEISECGFQVVDGALDSGSRSGASGGGSGLLLLLKHRATIVTTVGVERKSGSEERGDLLSWATIHDLCCLTKNVLIFFLVCCSVVGENICALALITKRDQESIQEKFLIFDLEF